MSNVVTSESIQTILALLHDCYQEAAATMSSDDEQVTEKVMGLFRNEDLQGIANLMDQTKLEKDFVQDLQQFIQKWSAGSAMPLA